MKHRNIVPILIADDDLEDCEMIREAFEECRLLNKLHFVHDGEELMEYLKTAGNHENPIPGLILLDLNMPRKDGQEVLLEIKNNVKLRHIPVIVLTTSKTEEDILRTYDLGVNSYITKPVSFASLVELIKEIGHYWFEIVELPENGNHANKN
jgi:CheY-like chemotaxis protein